MSKVVISPNDALVMDDLPSADREALRDVNGKIAVALSDPTKLAEDAWFCVNAVC